MPESAKPGTIRALPVVDGIHHLSTGPATLTIPSSRIPMAGLKPQDEFSEGTA